MAVVRKPGQRKVDLSDEPDSEVLKKAKMFIRSDTGGRPLLDAIREHMACGGVVCGDKSADLFAEFLDKQLDGCRKRMFPRIDEVIRRAEEREAVEKLP